MNGSLAPEAPKSHMYELYGYVDHYGMMGGGHYTATVKHATSNQWYMFDDDVVTKRSEMAQQNSIISSSAYILFYRAKTMSKASSKAGLVYANDKKSPARSTRASASKQLLAKGFLK